MRLSEKKAVVLGGAGRIGGAIVKEFLKVGADVMAVDRIGAELNRLEEELDGELRRKYYPLLADINGKEEAEELVRKAEQTLGGIDIFVHSSGYIYRSPFLQHSLEELDALWEGNVRLVFLTCQAFGRFMESKRKGKIIVFASVGGLYPEENHAGYCAAKAGLIGFARVAALELAKRNIQLNIIAPGPTETTPFRSPFYRDHPEVLTGIEARTPAGRIGHPEDHIGLAAFLASEESCWITGQVILSDGGLSLT